MSNPLPRIACIGTEYRENSHVDVILTKFLEGCDWKDDNHGFSFRFEPQVDIASIYLAQFPERDLGRGMAKKHSVPMFDTLEGALTLGTGSLAVDGVILVGEHGDYPYDEKGRHLYPRREFFEETVRVFEKSGRVVPVYSDKHLSYSWENAQWMYDKARELRIPFLAGSSLPLGWRIPELELPLGVQMEEAVVIAYGPIEAYGYHAVETLQCMTERRKGGETGVAAVQCLSGDAVWQAADEGRWSNNLFEAALARSETNKDGDVRENATDLHVFLVDYADGLRASIFLLNGHHSDFSFSARIKGQTDPVATLFWLQSGKPYVHFAKLDAAIQQLFLTGQPPYPVERTLLSTGVIAAVMDSHFEGGKEVATPELSVCYSL